jgi:hypothetical protein
MAGPGKIALAFKDVYGDPPDDKADFFLKNMATGKVSAVRDKRTSAPIAISGLEPLDVYKLEIVPRRYRSSERFVRPREGKPKLQEIVLAADPARVSGIASPKWPALDSNLKAVLAATSNAEGLEGKSGQQLYEALDDPRKAGLLNIYAKMKHVPLGPNLNTFSFLTRFRRFRGDRIFAHALADFRDRVKVAASQGLFDEVPESQHTPPHGYSRAGSFKTHDNYGNLQITFFCQPAPLDFVVDVDIDDARGIGHLFQVLRNSLLGTETNPYDIHEILLFHQNIDPGYTLIFV